MDMTSLTIVAPSAYSDPPPFVQKAIFYSASDSVQELTLNSFADSSARNLYPTALSLVPSWNMHDLHVLLQLNCFSGLFSCALAPTYTSSD